MRICTVLAQLRLPSCCERMSQPIHGPNAWHKYDLNLENKVMLVCCFKGLRPRTFQPAAISQLITWATDMWSELMVIKGQCGGGKFSNQLGNSGRD